MSEKVNHHDAAKLEALARRGSGRPQRELDAQAAFEWALLGWSNTQIAAALGCDRKTLNRLAPSLARARARRGALVKLQRFHSAMAGDVRALRRLLAHQERDGETGTIRLAGEEFL
jgi:hypothetical protein